MRPTIDRTRKYPKVTKSEVREGDAITFDVPQPGVRYYRVTGRLADGAVMGYFVGTKKAEKPRVAEVIKFSSARAYLIERKADAQPKGVNPFIEATKQEPPQTVQLPPELQGDFMFSKVKRQGRTNIVVVRPGKPILTARDDHPNFAKILAKVEQSDENGLEDLFDIPKSIEIKFKRLSERVAVRHGRIYLDGDPVDNSLTKQVLKFLDQERDDWKPLVLFFEKVQSNPSENSRKQLFKFLDHNDLDLTPAGDLIAYKGVRSDDKGGYKSIHAGPESDGVLVDGVPQSGTIPNPIGAIIEMPRSKVRDDPQQHCSVGLHVATENYAGTWTSVDAVLEVHVNARDVVSVPNDSAQKVRCCRYKVARVKSNKR